MVVMVFAQYGGVAIDEMEPVQVSEGFSGIFLVVRETGIRYGVGRVWVVSALCV